MKWIFGFLILVAAASSAAASERAIVCAKYDTQSGWSSGYKVSATITKGSELNQATHSLNYVSYSTYVVIFWSQNEASVILMDFPYLSTFPQNGTDQEGRRWEVAKTSFCY
jgi:hypothetical protein